MSKLERYWYYSSYNIFTFLLLPFAALFRYIVSVRRFLYKKNILKTHHVMVPVIVVGNITVGGTGKTPFVIWLAQFLKMQGFRPGIVSRGVGGKQERAPRWVYIDSNPRQVGDEAVLLARRSQCHVVIGIDRVAAVNELLKKTDCNVVISDDGLQHYRLGRDVEIAIIDGERRLGNRTFLPAGPLRESPDRLKEVDFVICNKDSRTARDPHFQRGYDMELKGDSLVCVSDENIILPLKSLEGNMVHAVAGIGNPQRFFASLRERNIHVMEHIFPDHHIYQSEDIRFEDDFPIVMTEKDAVKCKNISSEKCWYVPVDMKIDPELGKKILQKLIVDFKPA